MAQDYAEWLAINVLNEQQLVTYRSLSRALKVQCNLAKQMLYDFHQKQNARRAGTVHATYLITGIRRKEEAQSNGVHSQQDEEDTAVRSSPLLPSSSMPGPDEDQEQEPVLTRTVMVVREERLEQAKAKFESITGMHVYSLQSKGLGDIQLLTACNRKIAADYASENPLEVWKQYSTIRNPNVRRRTQRRQPPPPPPAAVSKPKVKPERPTAKPTVMERQASKDSQDSAAGPKPLSAKASPEPTRKPPTNKRQGSDIFKSFAKGRTKAKKEETQAESTEASETTDAAMTGFSDEEPDADEGTGDEAGAANVFGGKSRKDREAELQAMMDQEDDSKEEVDEADAGEADDGQDGMEDEGAVDKLIQAEEPKEIVAVENGRRRGKRRVMKKVTAKDEDGYLGKLRKHEMSPVELC